MEVRDQAFQQLKPACVKLSESALRFMSKTSKDAQEVTTDLNQLLKVLRAVSIEKNSLNNKLAEYVFFPLSNVLRSLEKLPLHARELTFDCILILLQHAWSRNIAPELGMQLLILYSFVAEQDSTSKSEELQTTIFKSFAIVFTALGESLANAQNIPHLGKAVSLILERGVLGGGCEEVQVAAVVALNAFVRALGPSNRDALGTSFLPGIVSGLAKVLSGGTGKKTWSIASAEALRLLTYIFPLLFGDAFVQNLPDEDEKGLSKKWAKATAGQIKMALANIMKLQMHDRQNVRLALGELCVAILRYCPVSLADSVSMVLEATLTLATQEARLEAELRHLLTTQTEFAETLQSSLHYWIMSLPRLMDSADETKKHRRIHQITLSFRLLKDQGLDMSVINRDLAINLRDSTAGAIKNPNQDMKKSTVFEVTVPLSLDLIRTSRAPESSTATFENIIALRKVQIDTVNDLAALTREISTYDSSLSAAQDIIMSIYSCTGDLQIASFWLVLNMVREAITSPGATIDDFFTFGNGSSDAKKELLEQLYDFSISTLSDTPGAKETDWRLQALALETVALQATQLKEAFRGELIDTLYPVLHFLGSGNSSLQNHAMTTLNIITRSCGYSNCCDLIVDNVDYLVNAVALRLNTFDISPQAPQVLLMMVRLAGPTLLPYLDDTVESIFAALEFFHGYPKLVDLLFKVLKVIVNEGAKADQLAITDGRQEGDFRKNRQEVTSIDRLVSLIHEMRQRSASKNGDEDGAEKFPRKPWGEKRKDEMEDGDYDAAIEEPEDKPPAPRTYAILLNISRLTQHYLTVSSSDLRNSLLDLLSVAIPALARHENSFLPLIHTLWPVLLPRISDAEPYVVSGSLRLIGLFCKYAGDFMTGRIEEAWPQIRKIWKTRTGRAGNPGSQTKRAGETSNSISFSSIATSGGTKKMTQEGTTQPHYVDAPSRIIWDGLVCMLVDIVTHTAINDAIFDDVVEMLSPVLTSKPEVYKALEMRNADAVWLALFRLDREQLQRSQVGVDLAEDFELTVTQSNKLLATSEYNWAALR
ncbi:hypothetical protein, variant [Verruconis gallopava]|uniref:Uncharacterized protein n=1 Tax=Verruconis gallopava TaxID=253628 RepID=A0A0D1XIE9_9PEZI|nr:uncharacterized protein PV09_06570 [Verruconis gallopava]XP_016211945.1 hypothetical protein, variant [Verruconis gallopava]KIW02075.1 hypothetical protein PV09_06570 [Verruconis gallopava]KIW02076.1 hypothetical protein, variant [Verruconis gallopava]